MIREKSWRTERPGPENKKEWLHLEESLDNALNQYAGSWPRTGGQKRELDHWITEYVHFVANEAKKAPPLRIPEPLIRSAEQFQSQPVFIVGYKKSGTTLVRNLLDGHPQLTVLPSEGRYWTDFLTKFGEWNREDQLDGIARTWVRRLTASVLQPPFWLLGRSRTASENPYVRFVQYLRLWSDRTQKFGEGGLLLAVVLAYYSVTRGSDPGEIAHWVEKTPSLERKVPEILRVFPDAKFIHVVRDPRAVTASLRRIREEKDAGWNSILKDSIGLRRSLELARQYRRDLGEGRYYLLRFEDLVANTRREMSLLQEWLNITFDDVSLTPTVAGLTATSNSAYKEMRVSGKVYSSSVKKYRDSLSAKDLALIEKVVFEIGPEFGYNVHRPSARLFLPALGSALIATATQAVKMLPSLPRK